MTYYKAFLGLSIRRVFLILVILLSSASLLDLKAQSTNDVLNLMITNKTITQEQADSVRAEAAIKDQESAAKKNTFQISAGKILKVSGYGQFRYQYIQDDKTTIKLVNKLKTIDGFDIRRAYLDVKGDITPYWSYRLQIDFAGSPKIIDVYTEFKPFDAIGFTIGQQLLPFSLNNVTSNTKLILADRSQVVEAATFRKGDILGDNNGRDIGVSAFGSLLKKNDINIIEYRLGVFNGSGINTRDLNEKKDFSGRLLFHLIKDLNFGGSFISGTTPDSITLKTIGLEIPKNQLGKRQRIGAEISYTYKFLNVSGEYISFQDGKVSRSGYYTQIAAFILPNKVQVAGRFDSFDKDVDKDKNIANNITFGVNYFINPNAVLQAAYTVRKEEGTSVKNDYAALQLQISF